MWNEYDPFDPTEPYPEVNAYLWVVSNRFLVVAQNRAEADILARAYGVADVAPHVATRRAYPHDTWMLPMASDFVRA